MTDRLGCDGRLRAKEMRKLLPQQQIIGTHRMEVALITDWLCAMVICRQRSLDGCLNVGKPQAKGCVRDSAGSCCCSDCLK